jgi:hypothetical protein
MILNNLRSKAPALTAPAVILTVLAFATGTASAEAATTTQQVSGTGLGVLAIAAAAPAAFTTGFQPGSTATTTGLITVTDTSPSWTLSVQDAAAGTPGHMVAASTGCTGSASSLANPLSVNVTSLLGGVTSAGATSISGTNQTVASASNQLLAANIFTANYSQTIGAAEAVRTGCIYSLTATYTLQ